MDLKSDSRFYVGSRTLAPVASYFGLSTDKFNFLFCQLMFLVISYPYRILLHPSKVTSTTRHLVALGIGLGFGYFCFGYQILHLLVQATIIYGIILFSSPDHMHKLALVVGMGYLSITHIMRQIYDYGGYHLDVTGPLMVATQKVTSIAFNLHDGLCDKQSATLHPEQRRQMVRKVPTLLEYYSYVMHYHTLMCGPLVFFNDYQDFIKGKQYLRHSVRTGMRGQPTEITEPSPNRAVAGKVVTTFLAAASIIYLLPLFPIEYIREDEFFKRGWVWQMLYIIWATSLHRHRYYHAWTLGEAICNAAGFGFNGYTSDGKARWNLLTNVDILTIETSLNLRELLISWNKSTQTWLRNISYERVDRHRTQLTFVLSAMWHGFYPGYYLTFGGGTLFTLAARSVRRSVRPMFQHSNMARQLYDLLTCLATRMAIGYIVFPFLLLDFYACIRVYKNFWFLGHILALLAMTVLPQALPPSRRPSIVEEKPDEDDGKELFGQCDEADHAGHVDEFMTADEQAVADGLTNPTKTVPNDRRPTGGNLAIASKAAIANKPVNADELVIAGATENNVRDEDKKTV
ncbi:unnamed protein product [Ixodes hexagonus]